MSISLDSSVRQPRRRPAPSPRNLQIYLDYQVAGKSQSELARQYKLTQCRISQIIRRVESWRSCGAGVLPAHPLPVGEAATAPKAWSSPSGEPGEGGLPTQSEIHNPQSAMPIHSTFPTPQSALSPTEFDFRLQSERLNLVCREAIRHFMQPQVTRTRKKGTRGDKSFDETTRRQHPANLQCLKIILQANAQHQRLTCGVGLRPASFNPQPKATAATASTQSAIGNRGTDDSGSSAIDRDTLEAWLTQNRHENGQDHYGHGPAFVTSDLVSAFLGEPNSGTALSVLARDAGKKIVDRKPWDDSPPQIPPRGDGWYYPMYDDQGGIVVWLHQDQVAGAVPPEYPPHSRHQAQLDPPSSPEVPASPASSHQELPTPISSTCTPPPDSTQTQSPPSLPAKIPLPESPSSADNSFGTPNPEITTSHFQILAPHAHSPP